MRHFFNFGIVIPGLAISLFNLALFNLVLNAGGMQAQSLDDLAEKCTPKQKNTHDCLAPLPAYSYILALPSDYAHPLCLALGNWDGLNQLVVEWDGLQTPLQIQGKAGQTQLVQPAVRVGRGSGIVVYSHKPIFPDLIQGACSGAKTTAAAVTPMQWPAAAANVADGKVQPVSDGLAALKAEEK